MTQRIDVSRELATINSVIEDPSNGLPESVFLFVSTITPMVNVDLLIKNEKHQTLMTWRDCKYTRSGWHIPGGIIRYKETAAERIVAVARLELGASVVFEKKPLAINELIIPGRRERGHFISLLYQCSLVTGPNEETHYHVGEPRSSQWAWFGACPENIIPVHKIYREYFSNTKLV